MHVNTLKNTENSIYTYIRMQMEKMDFSNKSNKQNEEKKTKEKN